MAEEMREHLTRRVQANLAAGMAPDEARFAAQRQFGGVDQLKEVAREQRGWLWLEQAGRDLRLSLRYLAKNPGFTAVAVLSLGLGIGACTAVFSIVNGVLLRSLPVPSPHELRVLQWTGTEPRLRSFTGDSVTDGNRLTGDSVSAPMFASLREQGRDLAEIFAFAPLADVTVRVRDEAFVANGMIVSDNFFLALGVLPRMGRLFAVGDATGDGAQGVVITADFWEKHFSRDPNVADRSLTLNGSTFTIAGVLPPEFRGVRPGQAREFYVLLAPHSPFLERPIDFTAHWWLRLMARLKPAGDEARLKAGLDLAFAREPEGQLKGPEILVQPGAQGVDNDRSYYRKPLLVMLGIVGLVMLVACANVAGLSLARGAGRQHELAVRAALGAGRGRLLRQSLVESLVLSLLGGVLGVGIAVWSKAAIGRLLLESARGLHYAIPLDWRLLGFALLAALATALLAGLLPALSASRVDPLDGLKARGALGAPRLRMGKILVAAQVGLSVLLLAGAGVFVRTLVNVKNIDAGFRTENLLVFRVNPAAARLTDAERNAFYAQVQQSLADLPGVHAASLVMHPLLANMDSWSGSFRLSGRPVPPTGERQTNRLIVGENFFTTMGLPILQGRGLVAGDTDSSFKALVVNETFVRKYLPGENPVGQTVNFLRSDWKIVGVCRDAKTKFIKDAVAPVVYFSFRQYPFPFSAFVVRTELPPLALAAAARQAVAAINPQVPIAEVTSQNELRDRSISQERLFATLGGVLAGLALLLSCLGLYGLMAYNVTRRSSEIGIRLALGATPGIIARSVLREAGWLAAAGIALGVPAAIGATHLLKSQLYGVQPGDPLTLGLVTLTLAAITVFAAWLPARRATRINPLNALRAE